jgi:iron complex transport system substrate-binding protein
MLATAIWLAGCTAVPVAPVSTPVAGTASETPTAALADTPSSEATTGEGETRVITHAMGETEVPANPLRVVVLDLGELDAALSLGIKPVGAVTSFDDDVFPSYLQDQTKGLRLWEPLAHPI